MPPSPKPNRRETSLWIAAAVLLVSIYSTLDVARQLTNSLRDRGHLGLFVISAFVVAGVALTGLLIGRDRPSGREAAVLLTIAVAYVLAWQLFDRPEERLHLLQYGGVGGLVYLALLERRDRLPASPLRAAPTALLLTGAAGWVDEGIQALLPSRFYDLRDVGFNLLAGAMAIASLWLWRVARGVTS